jgi:general secretion pathway protein G
MNKKFSMRASKGFTIIEILIVATIIALIVGFAANRIFGGGDRAKASLAKSRIMELTGALDLYKLDMGRYPSTQEGLKALLTAPGGAGKWNGPYMRNEETIKDPWDNDLIYRSPGEGNRPFEIVSKGSDGAEGGEGSAKDIKSWE